MSATAFTKGRSGCFRPGGLSARPSRRSLRARQLRLERLEERSLLSVVGNEGEWAFNIDADGTNQIQIWDTALDTSGNLYIAGSFNGVYDFDPGPGSAELESANYGDGFLVQYHADGTLGWLRQVIQGPGSEVVGSVAVDTDGNVYITGWFNKGTAIVAGQTLVNVDVGDDAVVVKYPVTAMGEEPGEPAWIDQFPCTWYLQAEAIEVDNAGHVYVGGDLQMQATFGDFTLYERGWQDAWVTKLDATTGTVEWAWQTSGTTGSANILQIVVEPPGPNGEIGKVFAAGFVDTTEQAIYFDDQPIQSPGGYVTRLDPATGAVVWAKSAGYAVYNLNLGGPDASLYLTGVFQSEADLGGHVLTSAGGYDIFAGKMDPATGDFLWAASVGGPNSEGSIDFRTAIAATQDGDVYLTGHFKTIADLDPGPGAAILTGSTIIEGFLARIDPQTNSLERLWHLDAIGDSGSAGTHLALDTDLDGVLNVYVVGRFRGTVELPPGTINSADPGRVDIFAMKFAPKPEIYTPAVVAADDSYTYWEDYVLTVPIFEGVLANDTDANHGSLSVIVPDESKPQNGTVVMNPDGSFTYTPYANFAGIDTFSYQVSDGRGGLDIGAVTIQVNSIESATPATFASTDIPKALRDYGTTTSIVTIQEPFQIADLNVRLDITHPRDPDLDVFLIAPDGTRVELFTDVGTNKSVNFTDTLLDDGATRSITAGKAPFTGTFLPEGNLAAFEGKSIQGAWTLEIRDDQNKQVGTLNSWSLIVTPADLIPDSGTVAALASLSQPDARSVDRILASDELDLATLAMFWDTP